MTPTAQLRALVRDRMVTMCSKCGHLERLSLRDVGKETGVSAASVSRFLAGHAIDSDTFDRLHLWVETSSEEAEMIATYQDLQQRLDGTGT